MAVRWFSRAVDATMLDASDEDAMICDQFVVRVLSSWRGERQGKLVRTRS